MTPTERKDLDSSGRTTTLDADGSELELALAVRCRTVVAEGVVELILVEPEGRELPEWSPGSHIDLLIPSTRADQTFTRQYSLCGLQADRHAYRIAVLLEPEGRGGSRAIHEGLGRGDLIHVRGPRNNFPLEQTERYLFVGGGIGITPLMPMIAQLERRGTEWRLLYGGRSRESMAYVNELVGFGDRVFIRPQDQFGLLNLAGFFGEPDERTLIYCCGPAPLLDAAEQLTRSWPARSLRVERFSAVPLKGGEVNRPIELTLARSGVTLNVAASDSILDTVERAGVAVLASCREGTCGTCETRILDGRADHRDSVLSPEEQEDQDAMFICVSRALTPALTLDL